MPRYQLPPTPKGFRQPGSGRQKGQPNKISIQVRELVSELMNDARYQYKLRQDFAARRVHPAIEALIWSYHLGKPMQPINLQGSMALDVTGRLEEERRIFAQLDVRDLEQLAAESQALVDRAIALTRASRGEVLSAGNASAEPPVNDPTPQGVRIESEPTSAAAARPALRCVESADSADRSDEPVAPRSTDVGDSD